MIVITAPTGKIGSRLVPRLLAAGEKVRVIARDPSKLASISADRIEFIEGSIDDVSVLDHAFEGATAVFWLVPSPTVAPSVVEHYLHFTDPAADALARHGVERVVAVSSLYRGLDRKTGPGRAVLAMDNAIERANVNYRAIWSANHMDNLLRQTAQIREGTFAMPMRSDVRAPIVATQDVAQVAAGLLLDRSWTGTGGVPALGPEDLSYDAMAAILGDVLGRTIRYNEVSEHDFLAQMTSRGASEDVAQWLFDMFQQAAAEPYGGENRASNGDTPTSFRQWCETVLRPAVES